VVGPPYGWRVANGNLEAVPAQQAVLAEARALRAAGLSLRAVAALLAEYGFAARSAAHTTGMRRETE
jgi:hypothetical protein